jgi:hypothetical protein
MFSKDEIKVKIEQKDGSYLTYNLSDISEINFKEYSLSNICNIYIKPDSVFRIESYRIISLSEKKGDNIDSLSIFYNHGLVYPYYSQRYINLPLNIIDSIAFENTNTLFGKSYRQIDFSIQGITSEFKSNVINYPNGTNDSSTYSKKLNKSLNIVNSFTIPANYDDDWECCDVCYGHKKTGDLYYCGGYVAINHSHKTNSCTNAQTYLYIDTIINIIDSLIFISDAKSYMDLGGSNKVETIISEKLVLYSLPFSLQSDGRITVNSKITDFSKIIYDFYYSDYDGNNEIYTLSTESFSKFISLTDSATISIVIRE